jgi:FkbM family methyltransferase
VNGALRTPLRFMRLKLRPNEIERWVSALGLTPDDVAIDCGANVGVVTVPLARTGATIHAFEPNPAAFAVLSDRVGGKPNVELHQQAVLDRADRVRLYLHADAADDPIGASVGSSLLAFKYNVNPDTFVTVDAVDLAEFVLSLDRTVRVVKLDVEGVECSIVHRLVDSGAIERIDTLVVELHDHHIPQLQAENDALRSRIEREGLTAKVLTTWK